MSPQSQLSPLVKAIKGDKKVTFFLGAGVSTSCGIPDFRSPKTGLYANLKRLNLPYPEAVFDIDFFKDDPTAFYTLCEELYPGKFFPSRFHYLLRLFQEKSLLARVYTQNIDTLESLAGVEASKIVAAHGSFAENHCVECSAPMSTETLMAMMKDKESNKGIPTCEKCSGYVKPDIVFFGEGLPTRFFDLWDEDSENVEVAIVAGTSLTVYPFAGLPSECGRDSLRVLINNEIVGDFKSLRRKTDLVFTQDCDTIADLLAAELGWKDLLDALIESERVKFDKGKETEGSPKEKKETDDKSRRSSESAGTKAVSEKTATPGKDEAADTSDKLAEELEKKLEKFSL